MIKLEGVITVTDLSLLRSFSTVDFFFLFFDTY